MGRGLSELQKQILIMAHQNCVKEGIRPPCYAVLLGVKDGQSIPLQQVLEVPPSPDGLWPTLMSGWIKRLVEIEKEDIGRGAFPIAFADSFSDGQVVASHFQQHDFPVWLSWHWPVGHVNEHGKWVRQDSALWNYEVLWHCFGFGEYALHAYHYNNGARSASARHFDPEKIGRQRYDAAKASVSRAIKRLSERHLVFDHRYGFHLTPEGAVVAAQLAESNGLLPYARNESKPLDCQL